jgi:hypothetical protein
MAKYLIFVTSVINKENSFCPNILVGATVGALEGASGVEEVVGWSGIMGFGLTTVGDVGGIPVMNGVQPGGGFDDEGNASLNGTLYVFETLVTMVGFVSSSVSPEGALWVMSPIILLS